MWIVVFALRYRYTIGVLAILILLFGLLSARRMSSDILPRVDSPEITLVWTYGGLDAREMASKITSFSEIATMNNVDDLVEVRSETSNGVALVKLKFQPYVQPEMALAQATSVSQTIVRRMPTGTTPPLIVRTSPSSVPILQLVISSDTLGDAALFDFARLNLRAQVQSIPGIRMTLPYGGASRQIMVDLNPDALNAYGLSADDVGRALAAQNLTLPSGTLREGTRELPITANASPATAEEFLNIPLRSVDGRLLFLRDVANVRDGESIPNSIARLNGDKAVITSILKLGGASTIDIVNGIMERLPGIRASAPAGVKIEPIFDQSIFVRAAIDGVLKEIVLVGCLVALVVLLFLGSWRSTLIVLSSIPLALLASIIGLKLSGVTFNLMSLGGLALAIGILVDNALVEIENIKRQIATGKGVRQAILDGARQVAFPEFVSTLGICIVFLPVFLLSGTAAFVFKPLALAVVFAMAASYFLSRTLVPTLASLLLPAEVRAEAAESSGRISLLRRLHHGVEAAMAALGRVHGGMLGGLMRRRWLVLVMLAAVTGGGVFVWKVMGREFFPAADAGLMRVFLRVTGGGRLESTDRVFAEIHREIRKIIPPDELAFVVENVGAPTGVNLAWVESSAVTSGDGEILVQLADGHRPTAGYVEAVRAMLREKFPGVQSFFRPADATSQTLASGAPTVFELRFIGRDVPGNMALSGELMKRMKQIPGVVDVTRRELIERPGYYLEVDRERAARLGVTQQSAVSALLAALGSGGTVSPGYWSDPVNGSSYEVQLVAPPSQLNGAEDLLNLPVRVANGGPPVLLRAFATLKERASPASISRSTLAPAMTILANVQGRDLGAVTRDLSPILDELRKKMKPGNRIDLGGQAALMQSAYTELAGGLALAALLVYLVMVVNFQSWGLPLVAISGLPLAVCGALAAPVAHGHAAQRPGPDGDYHGRRCFHGKQRAGDEFCPRLVGRGTLRRGGRAHRRQDTPAAGADDGGGDDSRGGADGDWLGRGRRTERAPRPRGHRRPLSRHPGVVVPGARGFPLAQTPPPHAGHRRRCHHHQPRPTHARVMNIPSNHRFYGNMRGRSLLPILLTFSAVLGVARVHADPQAAAVKVAEVTAGGTDVEFVLPARTAPAEETWLHSRATGVVSERPVDIGDQVKAGDVLAVISAPEIDFQIANARAMVAQAEASAELAKGELSRARTLAPTKAIAVEDIESREAKARMAEAEVHAMQAELGRLLELQKFQTIRAPFPGTIAGRQVERGAHVRGDQSQAEQWLYHLVRLDELRVLVDATADVALRLPAGAVGMVSFAELPGKVFPAKLARSSGVVEKDSGTMRLELVLPNKEHRLPAGLAGSARFKLENQPGVARVPGNAMLLLEGKPHVVVVSDGKARFTAVTVGKNLGTEVEILSGVAAGDRVVLSPNSLLKDGDPVRTEP